DDPAVGALANLDIVLVMLLAHHRREQGLLGDVVALIDAGAITIDQAGQQDLIQTGDELMMEHRPQHVVFEVRVHTGKGARHRLSSPWFLENRTGQVRFGTRRGPEEGAGFAAARDAPLFRDGERTPPAYSSPVVCPMNSRSCSEVLGSHYRS